MKKKEREILSEKKLAGGGETYPLPRCRRKKNGREK